MRNCVFQVICLLLVIPCQARIITVANDGSADFSNIQLAINDAVNGDTVVVAEGLYKGEGNRQLNFYGKAITLQSEDGPQTCIIDCEKQGCGFYFSANENSSSVVDGFTITNGSYYQGGGVYCYNASPTITNCIIEGNTTSSYGGAVYCRDNSSPTITNCIIQGNSSGSYGGGIYCDDYSSPAIDNCIIRSNSTTSYGGGVYCDDYSSPIITDCTIQGNSSSSYGGGVYFRDYCAPEISNCIILDNSSNYSGGGVYCGYNSASTLTNCIIQGNLANSYAGGVYCTGCSVSITGCTIANNSANSYGGGMYCNDSTVTVSNCTISGNSTDYRGGGIDCYRTSMTITNCTITGNSTTSYGGGMYCYYSSPIITNCTFNANSANYGGGGIYCSYESSPVITNTVFSNCTNLAIYEDYSQFNPTVKFCLFHNNPDGDYWDYNTYQTYTGAIQINNLPGAASNIDGDPLFAFPDDTHIMHGSACIDRGTNNPPGGLPPTDKDGNPRPLYGGRGRYATADIGAYEYNSQGPSIALTPSTFEFVREQDSPNPKSQLLQIRNSGGKVLNWQIDEECPWLALGPAIGVSATEINEIIVSVDTEGLPRGVYTTQLTVSDPNAFNNPRAIWVTLRIKGRLYVPEEYSSIQGAIDASMDGETIQVSPGTYNEHINVNKKLELIGITSPRLLAPAIYATSSYGDVVTLSVDGCILDSFQVIGGNTGIRVNSSNNIIRNNTVSSNNQGIELTSASGSSVLTDNKILNNTSKGLYLNRSGGNFLRENNIAGSPVNFEVSGSSLSQYEQDIDISNTVDGRPIYYLVGENDAVIDSSTNAGCVVVVNCTDVVVYDLELSNNGTGVLFAYTQNSNIENVTAVNNNRTGILLHNSTNNRLIGNNVSKNNYGIQLSYSSNNTLMSNVCADNHYNFVCEGGSLADYQHDIDISNTVDGRPIYYLVGRYGDTVDSASNAGCVFAVGCSNVIVRDLTVSNNGTGVTFVGTSNSSIENVTAMDNVQAGILLFNSMNSIMRDSSLLRNTYGVSLLASNYAYLENNFVCENSLGVSCTSGSLNILNSVVKNNFDQGGLAFFENSSGSIINCTIYGNTGQSMYYPYGGGISSDYSSTVTVSNSIIWANTPSQIVEDIGAENITARYSDIQGHFPGIGNINENPLITPDGHLRAGSPCINMGEPYVAYTQKDMDGDKRVHDVTADIGADEYIDTNGDGLPDWWEMTYFDAGDIAPKPDEDPDEDGHTNLSEYQLYSSDPTVPCATYYVDANQPTDSNDGLSWETAKRTILAAIEAAENSDKVLIASGLYFENVYTLGREIIIQSMNPIDPAVVASTITGGFSINRGELQGCIICGLTISSQYDTGVLCQGTSPTISNCTITGNRSSSWERGGGVTCLNASPIISNCIISGNVSPERGGGIYCQNSTLKINNCVISGNLPYYGGGQGTAIYALDTNLEMHQCTIANNEYPQSSYTYGSAIYGEQGNLKISNSILWNNMNTQISGDDLFVTIAYSDIKGGQQGIQSYWVGQGNIDVDPYFVSIGYWTGSPGYSNAFWVDGDYHLQSQGWRWIPYMAHGTHWVWDGLTSLCIDAGNPGTALGDEILTVPVDPNGEWGKNVRVNMGAYGGTIQASMAPCDCAILGDLTNDGIVDFIDLARWAEDSTVGVIEHPADLDRNASVNLADLALLVQDWLVQTSWFGTVLPVQPPSP